MGLLDVVELLAPDPNSLLEYKREVVTGAIQAIAGATDSKEAIQCLFLLSERFGRRGFSQIGLESASQLAPIVGKRLAQHPELALEFAEKAFATNADYSKSFFLMGILLGLRELASANASSLSALRHFPNIAPQILSLEPAVAAGYFRGIVRKGVEPSRSELVAWLSSLRESPSRKAIRAALLPELKTDEDSSLAAELLGDVHEDEIPAALDALSDSTNLFTGAGIRAVVEESVSRVHPLAVQHWAENVERWSDGLSEIVASSYSVDRDGLRELLANPQLPPNRQAQVVAKFLMIAARGQFPQWLRDLAREDQRIFVQLLAAGSETADDVAWAIQRVLDEIRMIPIADSIDLAQRIGDLSNQHFYSSLTDAAMRSVISGYLTGLLSLGDCKLWQDTAWAKQWLGKVETWVLRSSLTSDMSRDREKWSRAWHWIAEAPAVLYERQPAVLPQLLDGLIFSSQGWSETTSHCWAVILDRAARESRGRTHLALCAQALRFAFTNIRQPMGEVVAASFFDVYRAVVEEPVTPPETSFLFSVFDWDKGKELRKELVRCFYHSNWSPEDLALAAREEWLLRKIFKRIIRQPRGDKYVHAMLKNLANRKEPYVKRVHDQLEQLVLHPDFYEDWD